MVSQRLSPRVVAQMIRAEVSQQIRRLGGQIVGGVARAVLRELSTSGGFSRATVDLRADEERDDVEVLEPYGFTSAPPAGAEGVALAVGGDASHHVVLALGSRTLRLQGLKSGEVAMYTGEGQSILLKENGDIIVTPKSGRDIYLGPGALKKVALAEDVDDRLAKLQTAYDTHTHPTAPIGPVSTPTVVPTVSPVGTLAPTGAAHVLAE